MKEKHNDDQVAEIAQGLQDTSIEDEEGKSSMACAAEKQNKNFNVDLLGSEANLITFSKQKLAMLTCKYNQNRCGQCGKIDENLKTCSACRTARYCSRECQAQNWKGVHKNECKEIKRLKQIIQGDKSDDSLKKECVGGQVRAEIHNKPWYTDAHVGFARMCIHKQKQIVYGVSVKQAQNSSTVSVFNPGGPKETEHHLSNGEYVKGMCTVNIDDSQYIAVSIMTRIFGRFSDRLELWSYPVTLVPKCVYKTTVNTLNVLHFFEGHLLVNNDMDMQIHEYKVTEHKIKPTGRQIPTGVVVYGICGIKEDGKARIVILHHDDRGLSMMRCITYRGQQLWQLCGHYGAKLDGSLFLPSDVCTDGRGNLFIADPDGNRVVCVNQNRAVNTIFNAHGRVLCVAWSAVDNKILLYTR